MNAKVFIALMRFLAIPLLIFAIAMLLAAIQTKDITDAKVFSWEDVTSPEWWYKPITKHPYDDRPITGILDIELADMHCHTQYLCWAVGGDGTILHTDNGGKTWSTQTSNVGVMLYSVTFTDAQTGWAVGLSGTILHTNDGGKIWSAQTSNVSERLWSVTFTDAQTGWAVGQSGTILHTNNGGKTWSAQISKVYEELRSVTFTDAQTGWAVGGSGTILHTNNGGKTWSAQTSNVSEHLWSVTFTDAQTGWAVGGSGTILHTNNGGKTWFAQISDVDSILESVTFTDAQTGWAVGQSGTILHTNNGGKTWSAQTSNVDVWIHSVTFTDAQTGWAVVGWSGRILHTNDGGKTWSAQTSNVDKDLISVTFTDDQTGWAVGQSGTILHTNDGGKTWSAQASNVDVWLYSVTFTDDQTGWAVGSSGTILHTNNGGKTWSTQTSNVDEVLRSVTFTDDQTGWAVGGSGTILHTNDGGKIWSAQTSNVSEHLWSVTFTDAQTGWAVGFGGTILHTNDGGKIWSAQTTGVDAWLNSVTFTDAQTGWAVGFGGTILHTNNGGKIWSVQTSNVSEHLWSVIFTDAQTGWAVGNLRTILHTNNGGKDWKIIHDPKETSRSIIAKKYEDYRQWPSPLVILLASIGCFLVVIALIRMARSPQKVFADERGSIDDLPITHPKQDRLNYAPIARTIANLVRNRDSKPPMAVAVMAPWGSGKSSILHMLQHYLTGYAGCVWFNAWHYHDDKQILGALIEHIRAQALPPLLSLSNVMFRLRLLWFRGLYRYWRLWGVCLLSLIIFGIFLIEEQQIHYIDATLRNLSFPKVPYFNELGLPEETPFILTAVIIGVLIMWKSIALLRSGIETFSPALMAMVRKNAKHIISQMQTQDWSQDAGIRLRFEREFSTLAKALGHGRLVLLIDDLDRCSPSHINTVMTTLNFLFTTQAPCYAVIAMDWDYVCDAMGLHHKDISNIRKQDPGGFSRNFMKKIIQLRLSLPKRNNILQQTRENHDHNLQGDQKKTILGLLWAYSKEKIGLLYEKTRALLFFISSNIKSITLRKFCGYIWKTILWFGGLPKRWLSFVMSMLFIPLWNRIKYYGSHDIYYITNIVFIVALSGVTVFGIKTILPTMPLTQQKNNLSEENIGTQRPNTADTKNNIKEQQLLADLTNNSNANISKDKIYTISPPENKVYSDYYYRILLFSTGALITFLIWFFRQERDSLAFNQALNQWRDALKTAIDTPREWKALENQARFFAMQIRSKRTLCESLEDWYFRLKARLSGQYVEEYALGEGLATHLLFLDYMSKGKLSDIICHDTKAEEQNYKAAFDLYQQCKQKYAFEDEELQSFFENLISSEKDGLANKKASAQAQQWIEAYIFQSDKESLQENKEHEYANA